MRLDAIPESKYVEGLLTEFNYESKVYGSVEGEIDKKGVSDIFYELNIEQDDSNYTEKAFLSVPKEEVRIKKDSLDPTVDQKVLGKIDEMLEEKKKKELEKESGYIEDDLRAIETDSLKSSRSQGSDVDITANSARSSTNKQGDPLSPDW